MKRCILEIDLSHFNKTGWANIKEKFNKATKLSYDFKQFKNRWDNLKKDWSLWVKLRERDTGTGWNPAMKTIDADDVWWDARIQENPEADKFREHGLKFLPEMEFLYKGIVATGFAAYAPSEDSRASEGLNTGADDDIDNVTEMEVNENEIGVTTRATSSRENRQRKRGREEKRVGVAAKISAQLDCVIDQFESNSNEYVNDAFSIDACVDKLKNLPGLELGSDLFFMGIRLMSKRANRLAFVHLGDPTLQLGWIKLLEPK